MEEQIIRKWYIEITPTSALESHGDINQYIIQSRWFDKKQEAIDWANSIDWIDENVIGTICLMYSDGIRDENGEWRYNDIEQEKYIKYEEKQQ